EARGKALALAAAKAERRANALKAAEAVLRAEQDPGAVFPKTAPAKALSSARKALAAAEAALAKKDPAYTPLLPLDPGGSPGRRLALGRWIADRNNPLTARVAVNHIWLRHFGKPLVPTVANFGLNGKPPTQPELLDWLAVEFMGEPGASATGAWSM